MPLFPEDSTFLAAEDKELLLARVKADGGHIANEDITVKQVLHHLSDWKIWAAYVFPFLFPPVSRLAFSRPEPNSNSS
jgi:hypothetical protein